MTLKLLINAASIHSGGASILLNHFLANSDFSKYELVILSIDARFTGPVNLPDNFIVWRIFPSIISRIMNESRVCFFRGDIFCFGNLPPLFSRSRNVVVFLHNALFFEASLLSRFPLKTRLRLTVESLLFRLGFSSASKFLVQTPHMKRRLSEMLVQSEKIVIAPFADICEDNKTISSKSSFICVSSGDAHKNIENLILAWEILSQQNLYPPLILTISSTEYPGLVRWINLKILERGLNVKNLETLTHGDIFKIYKLGSALIFPSLIESLGLPLIEAREANVDIIAPELDYVRDVVSPVETFDPLSPISISRAVKRYLGIPEAPVSLVSASSIMQKIFD